MQIEFNGQMYKLETLVSLVGFGRQEKVNTGDIIVVNGSGCESKLPVCYVHDNATYLLAGKVDNRKAVQVVCILTKHVLKKALMSVQSQPMDTHIVIQHTAQTRLDAEWSNLGGKAKAALARLNVNNEEQPAPRREQPVRKATGMTERTRAALRVLEATLSRKEEQAEESDWK